MMIIERGNEKMPITYREISSEVENLHHELKRHKDEKLSHKDKIAVSDLLAETVAMIRKKYELTTIYYLASEIKAADGIGPADKDDCVEAEWINDGDAGIFIPKCSSCGRLGRNASPFCPNCGKRMRSDKS